VNDRYRDIVINRDIIYRPVRYDRITVYDRIYPGLTYKNRRYKEVPGLGDEMRRQDPGRPVEKGPPPGQIKKDKYDDRGGPPNKVDKPGNGPAMDKGKPGPAKEKGPADKKGGKPDKAGPSSDKGKSKGGGGDGKGKKN